MEKVFDSLLAFRLDKSGRVVWISRYLQEVTGVADQLLHTRDIWKIFYKSDHSIMADLLLKEDNESLFQHYGTNLAWLSSGRNICSAITKIDVPLFSEEIFSVQAFLLYDEADHVTGAAEIVCPVNLFSVLTNSPFLKTFINHLPVAVSVNYKGRIHLVNNEFARFVDLAKPEDAVGLPSVTFVSDPDKKRFIEENANDYAGLQSGGSFVRRYSSRGDVRYLEGRPQVFDWGGEKVLISVMTDVTDRVRREKRLLREHAKMSAEIEELFKLVQNRGDMFIGDTPSMLQIMEKATQCARTDNNVVIYGETGTGKTLLARVVHDTSSRKNGPFVIVNCAAIPESLFESEFFGHKKGAFTGAVSDSTGYFGAADKGTLVLDEVGELSKIAQAKLLHALESKTYMPVGGRERMRTDVRLICCTNRNLFQMMQEGALREDFYYRIDVVSLKLPALRERRQDIPALTRKLFEKYHREGDFAKLDKESLDAMQHYNWPGNIRELQSVVIRYLVTGRLHFGAEASPEASGSKGPTLPVAGFAPALSPSAPLPPPLPDDGELDLDAALDDVRRRYFVHALNLCGGSKIKAAAKLNMNLRTFHRWCAHLHLKPHFFDVS